MPLKGRRLFVRQLAIRNQYDVLLCLFTLHCLYLNQPQKMLPATSCFLSSGLCVSARWVLPYASAAPRRTFGKSPQFKLPGPHRPFCKSYVLVSLSSAKFARSLRVARKSVFFADSSVVLNISPMVRSLRPW